MTVYKQTKPLTRGELLKPNTSILRPNQQIRIMDLLSFFKPNKWMVFIVAIYIALFATQSFAMNEFITACVGDGANVTTDINGNAVCNSGTWSQLSYQDVITDFDLSQIPMEQRTMYFTAGFGLYFVFWALGMSVRAVFRVVNGK